MSEEEVTTLGAKAPGLPKDYIRERTNLNNSNGLSFKGKPSKPDIQLNRDDLRKEKLWPVKILRHYRPMTDDHFKIGRYIIDENGNETAEVEYDDPPEVLPGQDAGTVLRLAEGTPALLPLSEAKALIKRGIAERTDEIG